MQPPYQQPPYPPYLPQNQYPHHQPYQQFPYQPQPKKRNYSYEILGMLIVIGVLILAFGVAVVMSGGGISSIQRFFPTTCSVGIVGANATITFTGVNAETQCNQIVTNAKNNSWYELQNVQPSGNVMCEGTLHGDTIIVRDQGIFNIYGNELCSNFLKTGMTPTS